MCSSVASSWRWRRGLAPQPPTQPTASTASTPPTIRRRRMPARAYEREARGDQPPAPEAGAVAPDPPVGASCTNGHTGRQRRGGDRRRQDGVGRLALVHHAVVAPRQPLDGGRVVELVDPSCAAWPLAASQHADLLLRSAAARLCCAHQVRTGKGPTKSTPTQRDGRHHGAEQGAVAAPLAHLCRGRARHSGGRTGAGAAARLGVGRPRALPRPPCPLRCDTGARR